MSKLKTSAVQFGDNATATQNMHLRANNDGTFTLARGNVGAGTQDLLIVDANGKVLCPIAGSRTVYDGGSGYGATSTKVRNFTNRTSGENVTDDYTCTGTDGMTVTITRAGRYALSYADNFNAVETIGFSLNASSGATSIISLSAAQRLCAATSGGAGYIVSVSIVRHFAVGDVIRTHTHTAPPVWNAIWPSFSIERLP